MAGPTSVTVSEESVVLAMPTNSTGIRVLSSWSGAAGPGLAKLYGYVELVYYFYRINRIYRDHQSARRGARRPGRSRARERALCRSSSSVPWAIPCYLALLRQ